MSSTIAVPAGFRGTRGELLVALKRAQPQTAKELADRFGVTANALRRHLKELEVEGLVQYRREIRGVGGPIFAYSLSVAGEALFPRAYEAALEHALEHVKEVEGTDGIVRLFRRRWQQIAESAKPELARLPVPERAHRLAELLTSLGYMAEAVETSGIGSTQTLHEHNCAIRFIAERYPEVCDAEERFIEEVLGTEITRQAHIAKGANCCSYCIQSSPATEAPAVALMRADTWRERQ
jgi:DeoR family suf operon transcriptional repressor